jgi:hypothetical protein
MMTLARREGVPARFKTAVTFLLEQKDDLQLAAAHSGLTVRELRRCLTQTQCRRFMMEERRRAIEVLCLSSPAVLAEVMRGDNQMARTHAVRQAELLRVGAIEDEAAGQRRAPGLSIVLIQQDGGKLVAYDPPKQTPLLDAVPVLEPAVPATSDDAE